MDIRDARRSPGHERPGDVQPGNTGEIDSFDMDDLLSDESDNDDFIDNEEELTKLLRSQNLTLEDLLPMRSSSNQNKATIESGISQDPTLDNLTPPITVATPLRSPRSTPELLLPHEDQEMEDLDMEYQDMDDLRGDTEAVHTGTHTQNDPSPPVWISPEENARLTGIIREKATASLEINRAFQKALMQQLQEVEKAYVRNTEFRTQLKEIMDRQSTVEKAPVLLPSSNARLGPPYFVDQDNNVPPDNADTIRRNKRPLVVAQNAKRWTKEECENLKAGVISENKRLLFDMFSESGDIAGIQSLHTAPDVQMMLNTKGLDWSRIAQRYAAESRTASECLIRWTGQDHPGINKTQWSKDELDKLDKLAKKYQERNWIQIALDLDTNRTAAECFRKYQTKKTKVFSKALWTPEEDAILIEAVRLFGEQNWNQVSYCFEDRSATQCSRHWAKSLNPVIRRGRWLKEEDGALRAAMEIYGETRWIKIQQHILGRTDVQCRERYVNVLSPDVKSGPWTQEECEKLNALVQEHGEKKWALIASLMDGRTDNQCARRYRMMRQEIENPGSRRSAKEAKPYLSINRRKGRTTIAQLPVLDLHRSAIRKAAKEIRKKERFEEFLKRKREMEKMRVLGLQEKILQIDHDIFVARQRDIYNRWESRWGHRVDPIEKVFNLGIPTMPKAPSERTDDDISIIDVKAPDPASALRPGKVRPVPPCFATATAFSRLINQGTHSNGRFKLKNIIEDGVAVVKPSATAPLSVEEQQQPEYIELAERFESVFMWPMMMGMLHMGAARETINVPPRPTRQESPPQVTEDDDNEQQS
ncbi:Myb-like DNA-binding domain protein [Mortierella sp. AM989]|nr:Myb-like DNA-binding domain protein [Mortierella sp. AM989]